MTLLNPKWFPTR